MEGENIGKEVHELSAEEKEVRIEKTAQEIFEILRDWEGRKILNRVGKLYKQFESMNVEEMLEYSEKVRKDKKEK